MFIVEKFDDGSFSCGFESGDMVPLNRNFCHKTLNGDLIEVTPEGSEVKILGVRNDKSIGSWFAVRYFVEFPCGRQKFVSGFILDGSNMKPSKKTPPKIWIIEWHEGAMWKHTKVVAWTGAEAKRKLAKQLEG